MRFGGKKESASEVIRKERLYEGDFVRVVAMLIIIVFHTFTQISILIPGEYPFIYLANGGYGSLGNVLFFALSGAMLLYKNEELTLKSKFGDLIRFYKKRWLGIFPAYLLIWFVIYSKNVLSTRSFFYNGNPAAIILSFLGLDNYFGYRCTTYASAGEWFIGAIIILYVLYPLINTFFHKMPNLTLIIAIVLSFLPLMHFWRINSFQNIFSCIVLFVFGMWFMKNREALTSKWGMILAIIVCAFVCTIHIPIDEYFCKHITGIPVFITLYGVGTYIMKNNRIRNIVKFLSGISYEVFLVHHVIIYRLITNPDPMSVVTQWGWIVYIIMSSLAMGWLLHSIVKKLVSMGKSIF